MDEMNLNTVDAVQEVVVDPQSEQVDSTVETVNADDANVTTGKQEETKPVQSAEENAKYAEVRRKAEAEARDRTIAEMGLEWNGQPITTYDQYVKAKNESEQYQKEQAIRQEYESKGLPDDVVNELVESKKFREQLKAEQEAKEQQAKQQADMEDFIKRYPDVKAEDIPKEVWQANAKGIPLRYAYADYAQELVREAEVIAKANANNAKGSMGSISGDGVANDGYFTKEQVSKMTSAEIARNYEKICESTRKW